MGASLAGAASKPASAAPQKGAPPRPQDAPREDPTFGGFDKKPGVQELPPGFEENEALRSAGAKIFEVPGGGAHLAQLFAGAVHFRDEAGKWQEIDSSVVPSDGGYRNAAHEFEVFFPGSFSSASPVRADHGDASIAFGIAGASDSRAVPGETTVTYPGIFKDVDLEYAMTSEGYKENVILRSDKATSAVTYEITTDGLDLTVLEDGRIELRKGAGSVGFFSPFFAQEAPSENGTAGAATYDLSTDLTEVSEGAYELDVSVDEDWLDQPGRRYPVVIDPTFVTSLCGSCPPGTGIPLLKDASYATGQSTTGWENHGTLRLGRDSTFGSEREAKTYMTFDVAHQVRKVGNLIYDADFDIYNNNSMVWTPPGPAEFELKRITADWSEYGYGGLPTVDETKVWATYDPCTSTNCPPSRAWWRWDVKSIMQHWIDQGVSSNHGWRLSAAPGEAIDWRDMVSKESGWDEKPYMFVAVNAMPSTRAFTMDDPNWPYLDLASDALPDGSVINGQPVVLKIQDLTDTNQDPIVVRYQVSRSPTSFADPALVYDTGWMPEVSEFTVSAGTFTSGTYYWRVQASDTCGAEYVDKDEPELAEEDLCDDLSHETARARAGRERPTSAVRSFAWNPPQTSGCLWTSSSTAPVEDPDDGTAFCPVANARQSAALPFAGPDEILVMTTNVLQGNASELACPRAGKEADPSTPRGRKQKSCGAEDRETAFAVRVSELAEKLLGDMDGMGAVPDVILLQEVRRDHPNTSDDDVLDIVKKLNGSLLVDADADSAADDPADFRIGKARKGDWVFNKTGGDPPTSVVKADTAIIFNWHTMRRLPSPDGSNQLDKGMHYDATYTGADQAQGNECKNSSGVDIVLDVDLDGIDECKTRTYKRNFILGLRKRNSVLSVAVASVHLVTRDFLNRGDTAAEREEMERTQTDTNSRKKTEWLDAIATLMNTHYPPPAAVNPLAWSVTHRFIGGDFNIRRCIAPKYETTQPENPDDEPEERQACTERTWWTSLSETGYEDSVFAVHGATQASLDTQYQDGNVRREQRIDFVMGQRIAGRLGSAGYTGASHDITCGLPTNCNRLRNASRYSDHRLVWGRAKEPVAPPPL